MSSAALRCGFILFLRIPRRYRCLGADLCSNQGQLISFYKSSKWGLVRSFSKLFPFSTPHFEALLRFWIKFPTNLRKQDLILRSCSSPYHIARMIIQPLQESISWDDHAPGYELQFRKAFFCGELVCAGTGYAEQVYQIHDRHEHRKLVFAFDDWWFHWLTSLSLNLVCMAEENFREAFSLFPACQKLLPHLYPSIRGDLQGDLRMIYILFTIFESTDIRLNGSEKTLLTYIQKYRDLWGG